MSESLNWKTKTIKIHIKIHTLKQNKQTKNKSKKEYHKMFMFQEYFLESEKL